MKEMTIGRSSWCRRMLACRRKPTNTVTWRHPDTAAKIERHSVKPKVCSWDNEKLDTDFMIRDVMVELTTNNCLTGERNRQWPIRTDCTTGPKKSSDQYSSSPGRWRDRRSRARRGGAKCRAPRGVRSGEGRHSPSPVWGSGGYAPRKYFKKSTLTSPIFLHFCKLKWSHLHNGTDIVRRHKQLLLSTFFYKQTLKAHANELWDFVKTRVLGVQCSVVSVMIFQL